VTPYLALKWQILIIVQGDKLLLRQ